MSKDRLATVLENLVEIVKHKKHPATPYLQLGTKTNDAIRQLEEIFAPPTQDTDESSRVNKSTTDKRMSSYAETKVAKNKTEKSTTYLIGIIVTKKFGKGIHRGGVKKYDRDRKYYWIDYNNEDSEKVTQKQVKGFKFIDNDLDRIKRFIESSLRQNLVILTEKKENINQCYKLKTKPDARKNKTQFEKLKKYCQATNLESTK